MAYIKQWNIDQFRQKAFNKRAIKILFIQQHRAQKLCTYRKNGNRFNIKNNIY